jgi:membrane-associated phospholipid phosphatase
MDYRAFRLLNGLTGHSLDGLFVLLAKIAFGLWLCDRTLGGALLVLATILALSRVVVGTHYPGDVLAGAVIGAGVSGVLFAVPMMRRRLERVAERAGALWDRVPSPRPSSRVA